MHYLCRANIQQTTFQCPLSFSSKLARDVEYSKKKHHSCFSGFLLMISQNTLMYSYVKQELCLFCKMFISLLCNTIFAFLMRSVETLACGPSCTIAHHNALNPTIFTHLTQHTGFQHRFKNLPTSLDKKSHIVHTSPENLPTQMNLNRRDVYV